MERHGLTTEELGDVLRRAQEIDAVGAGATDMEAYVKAAEEAGISREATMEALRERLGYAVAAAQTGEFVFARSADGHYYAAKVEGTEGMAATVRFLNGATAKLPQSDLRELSLVPGQKLNFYSPSMSMWVNGTVTKFNRDSLTLDIQNWGSSETVSLEKVRVLQQHSRPGLRQTANLWATRLWWLAGGLGLGMLIERLLLH